MSKQVKSKPITTSVPSLAIRFHASGEELEEFYPSEEDEKSEKSITEEKCTEHISTGEPNKHESSPMRDYLNKFGKRSSSIDTGISDKTLGVQTATSDTWRLFSEFKGKLTKTVEEKLSEIKSKSNESENSPKLVNKSEKSKTNNSKENSSVSDSEEQSFSECSIPKSSGLNSTTEDIEMSSEDENSLAESEKTPTENITKEFNTENSPSKTKKHIIRHKTKHTKSFVQFNVGKDTDFDSQVKINSLTTVHEKEDDIESGVEAYEEFVSSNTESILPMVPDSVTLIAPTGFLDVRSREPDTLSTNSVKTTIFWSLFIIIIAICFVVPIPKFLFGFIWGAAVSTGVCYVYYKLNVNDVDQNNRNIFRTNMTTMPELPILEIQAVKEYHPATKFEGWMNEYPEHYDPRTYHIMKTQSVFLELKGTILRIYHTPYKIPKRAMWNEPKHFATFTHTRVYNLRGSQIMLLPTGLTHKRLWSKKYPVCIILNKEKMNIDISIDKKEEHMEIDNEQKSNKKTFISTKDNEIYADTLAYNPENSIQFDMDQTIQLLDDEKDGISESLSDPAIEEEKDEISINAEDWDTLTLDEACAIDTKIYLFARTCRDKEDWYRRLVIATRDISTKDEQFEDDQCSSTTATSDIVEPNTAANFSTSVNGTNCCNSQDLSDAPLSASDLLNTRQKKSEITDEEDYLRYMARFNQVQKNDSPSPHARTHRRKLLRFRKKKNQTQSSEEDEENTENEISTDKNIWINSFITRIFYDVCKHDTVINSFHCLIQRKLSTIKLPYFIENIVMNDLSLGKTAPTIHNIYDPVLDERGLWIYMDITYEGVTSMAIVTKLNLMKLKEQAGKMDEALADDLSIINNSEKSPIFHSDIEDSAESSDEETSNAWTFASNTVDANQVSTPRKPNTGGKKFLLMVDKIASSKYFQQATELKYIKRAMEGVSKTEIKLTVEVQHLAGTLALNIPPPPSDRVWIGFRGNPDLQLSAKPTFGERSINFMHVSRWIEKKLAVEFQKFFVLPNMEDFVLPILIPKLPE